MSLSLIRILGWTFVIKSASTPWGSRSSHLEGLDHHRGPEKTAEVQGISHVRTFSSTTTTCANKRGREPPYALCAFLWLGVIRLNWKGPSQPVVPSKMCEIHAQVDIIKLDRIEWWSTMAVHHRQGIGCAGKVRLLDTTGC
ncbi:MAG: hypothetical protein J3Q66DRAFT_357036 [Benniella sp.]|nr:MAG: hypothetical protein J3Q66DRAFT_357036 [Benniella sp.]